MGLYDFGRSVGNFGRAVIDEFTPETPEEHQRRLAGIRAQEERHRQMMRDQPLGSETFDPFFAGVLGAPAPQWGAPRVPPPAPGVQPQRPAIESAINWQAPPVQQAYPGIADGPLPAIEQAMRERESAPPPPQSRVNVTVGDQTYDYAGGREGNAPQLTAGMNPGSGQGFRRTWNSPKGGSVSMMTDNPNLTPERSIEAALRERDLADVKPAEGRLGEIGATRGEARPIEAAIYQREREAGLRGQAGTPKDRLAIEQAMARQKIAAQLEDLRTRLAAGKATQEETDAAVNSFLRDAIADTGLREGDLGPLASLLKTPF